MLPQKLLADPGKHAPCLPNIQVFKDQSRTGVFLSHRQTTATTLLNFLKTTSQTPIQQALTDSGFFFYLLLHG